MARQASILAALEDILDEVAGRAFAESEAGIDRIIALPIVSDSHREVLLRRAGLTS